MRTRRLRLEQFAQDPTELEHAREQAVLARARDLLEIWYWGAVDIRRHPSSMPPDKRQAAERRYQDLFTALETIDVMCPLAEALQSPSALVREALLLALAEIAR